MMKIVKKIVMKSKNIYNKKAHNCAFLCAWKNFRPVIPMQKK